MTVPISQLNNIKRMTFSREMFATLHVADTSTLADSMQKLRPAMIEDALTP